jgi:Domain of unknown function (DUF4331)
MGERRHRMSAPRTLTWLSVVATAVLAAVVAAMLAGKAAPPAAEAASHREAPLIALDPPADITDFFFFRSYEPGMQGRVVLIMDVMSEEPSSGPNYWNFDPNVVYTFNLDNNRDGTADDVKFEFRFRNEFRGVSNDLGLFLPYVALPAITKLEDGAGSEGLGLRQRYSVTMVKGGHRTVLADGLIAAPSNVGPRTMPNYDALAAQALYTSSNSSLPPGVRAFAGQRDDPFYIDLGAVFDTLNLRSPGVDLLAGFNVHEIALELPSMMISEGQNVLGAYASTSRPLVSVRGDAKGTPVQVQRLANPLVNEAIIGTRDKDRWNATEPEDEGQFLDYYTNLRLDTALQAVFGAPASPLLDIPRLLLTYGSANDRKSELLRLNLGVDPIPIGSQQRLTVLAGDNAGWPNGRRPIDDVTDIAVKVIGGSNYLAASDGVDVNDKTYPATFPFLASPHDGRNRVHLP